MNLLEIKQIIIWGHKLHSSAHSYIHYGFYKAFKELGYKILWLENGCNFSNCTIDYSDTLFIVEGQEDSHIPIISDCYYVLVNCDLSKYRWKDIHILILKVYSRDILFRPYLYLKKIDKYIYYEYESIYNEFPTIYMPWATDLLPSEIDENMQKIDSILDYKTNDINLVGSLSAEWYSARFFCFLNGIKFNFYNNKKVDFKEHEILIQNSYIAPSIQTEYQINQRYITSRIFKNISYGKMGLTNNLVAAELFDGNIIYHNDISKLLELGIDYEKNTDKELKKAKILFLMEYVKDNHTYINRIKSIFKCLNLIPS
jgi:hypothetical protein